MERFTLSLCPRKARDRLVRSTELVSLSVVLGSTSLTSFSGYCDAQCARDLKYINGEVRSTSNSTCRDDADILLGQCRGLEAI